MINPTRRSVLKAGLLGSLALAAAGGAYRATMPAAEPEKFVLTQDARAALSSIVPVMLGQSACPTPADVGTAVDSVNLAILTLPVATQQEIQELFGLLTFAPARRLVAGIKDDWHEAAPDDVAAFLQNWRSSRFAMLQSAYHALHDLIAGAWYADESNWKAIGYPGPLKDIG